MFPAGSAPRAFVDSAATLADLLVRHATVAGSASMTDSTDLKTTIAAARGFGLGDLLRRSARRFPDRTAPVSYTHLTLPTICSV